MNLWRGKPLNELSDEELRGAEAECAMHFKGLLDLKTAIALEGSWHNTMAFVAIRETMRQRGLVCGPLCLMSEARPDHAPTDALPVLAGRMTMECFRSNRRSAGALPGAGDTGGAYGQTGQEGLTGAL
ncbi:MAG: hypothetical protein BWY79_00277 [Actinobacteria bacterium ADurb.Bin444]|nr:MAG: hypothetical protein BWY79_00277 [Actinobacteria bacterium ADurb.Bin444]